MTQQEYSNIKTFVSNGGTLIVHTGNVFYAEVRYNEPGNSVTLVTGHYWTFDGKVAQEGVGERWENETKNWLGSNFYNHYYYEKEYHQLYNNPFKFTGEELGEEQYYDISNPHIKVVLNYNSADPRYPSYELNYGKVNYAVPSHRSSQ